MARPRQFEEGAALNAAMLCFWRHGYDATSIKDLSGATGLTTASLYNAFGDKRALYQRAFDHYVEGTIAERIRRLETHPGRDAIAMFFREILDRSLGDPEHKGCLLVNAAMETAQHEPEFRKTVGDLLIRLEAFFRNRVEAGQEDGTITRSLPPATLAQHLLGSLMGLRVLARARPERPLLEGVVCSALALLDRRDGERP